MPLAQLTAKYIGYTEKARERTLSDDETRALWLADSAYVALLNLLLLTGQRFGEARRPTWDDIIGTRWVIPKEHSKNKKARWVPYPGRHWPSRYAAARHRERSWHGQRHRRASMGPTLAG